MAFDVSAGLSSMGTAVAATAGAATLEAQKADLEMQKVKLADELAGKREETQRQFLTAERLSTQGFQSGENVLNRASAKDLAQIQADATVKAAGIHAGGTVAAANISAAASKYVVDVGAQSTAKQIEMNLRLGQKVIPGENGTLAVLMPGESKPTPVLNPDGTPFKSVDPEALKAQSAILSGAYKDKQDLTHLLKIRTDPLVSQINVLTKSVLPGMPLPPEVKANVAALKAEVQKAVDQYTRDAEDIQTKIDAHVEAILGRKFGGASPAATPAPGGLINRQPRATPAPERPSLDQLYNNP